MSFDDHHNATFWADDVDEMSEEGPPGRSIKCPYCGRDAALATGAEVYGGNAGEAVSRRLFWRCAPCDARVGCHEGGDEPFGPLADAPLRRARVAAHASFDRLWRPVRAPMARSAAYAWLAGRLGLTKDECHIGKFDAAACARVVEVCDAELAVPWDPAPEPNREPGIRQSAKEPKETTGYWKKARDRLRRMGRW